MRRGGLIRSLGLLQATAVNMSTMMGVGPFITIPLVLGAMGGPQAMLGWLTGLVIVLADGLIWSELAAALPGTGGSYRYLIEAYGPKGWGRLMGFLFIWQFILSGPLEIASGYIGFGQYLGYLVKLTPFQMSLIAAALGVVNLAFLYRRIDTVGRLSVILWVGALVTVLAVIATGFAHFNPALAFAFPPDAFHVNGKFVFSLGAASSIAIYDYLGYYEICYVGEEVRDPSRTLPRSIMISLIGVAAIYLAIYFAVIGVVPWAQAIKSNFVVSDFMQMIYGSRVAALFTLLILWTTLGSVFGLLLGYSRIPYAAARDGNFFRPFAALHPTGRFPHVSLLVIGGAAIAASFLPLDQVISALLTTRLLVQFLGQVFAVPLLRRKLSASRRPYTMWWYPLPLLVAGIGWTFVFVTSGFWFILGGLGTLLAGLGAYALWMGWRHARVKAA